MNDNRANFEKWFKEPILKLQKNAETGFILIIVSIALLERYLREKSGLHEHNGVDARFLNELIIVFPMLGKDDLARKFWSVCRNGLMHQATFRSAWAGNSVTVGLHEHARIINHQKIGASDTFMISPTKFSNRVLEILEADFVTFEAGSSINHPLSEKQSMAGYSGYSGTK